MHEHSAHSIEKFRGIVSTMHALPTDKIVEALDRQNFWDTDMLAQVQLDFKRNYVRRMLGRVRNDDGQRLFINIEVADSKGRRTRVYKNREKMSVDEYRQAIAAYCRRGAQGYAVARTLARDCKSIHGVQLRLPFTS